MALAFPIPLCTVSLLANRRVRGPAETYALRMPDALEGKRFPLVIAGLFIHANLWSPFEAVIFFLFSVSLLHSPRMECFRSPSKHFSAHTILR